MVKGKNFDTTEIFTVLLLSFVFIQVLSYLLSEFFDLTFIKMGVVLFLFLAVIGLTSLFVTGKKIGQLELKKDGIFILFVFSIIILTFIYLPDYIPQIFSSQSLEIRELLKVLIGNTIKLNPAGIVG